VHEPTGELEAFGLDVDNVPEGVMRLQDTVELPAWVPRSPDAPKASSRQLPVAPPSSGTPERVNIVVDPEPEDDEGGDEEDSSEAKEEPQAQDKSERRRRRRGRRGGRRNRDRGRRDGDPGPGSAPGGGTT
jgi:hypothetical protein